jgi:class 3 adenylate cyclase/tetratricopeptide (TPR) repeat protein
MSSEQRRERKVVTVLFCDLVGFTSRSESLDPEDVEAILQPYHARVRSELERHGGTVEKFIGDAVMALFGAPIAHEDDPERAVRASLSIRDFAHEAGLELRIGITTGEALVRLGAHPEAGEGMASGDVVNTAARLQSAAPVNGILVDDVTQRTTRTAIVYEAAPPVTAKGKEHPVSAWQPVEARSRFGSDVTHHARTELVGRDAELAMLRQAFSRAVDDQTPQLVTVVGVPGMGKSRLVYELSRIADEDPRLVTWRQGRCLAYGDGIAFWALAEMVKAQAGILEGDSESDAEAKLGVSLRDLIVDEQDRDWVGRHLRPLVGLEAETGLGGDRRGEAFAAWRRFVEALAEREPTVLAIEDVHWADDGLLDFVDELAEWMVDVPLLVICTARPELLDRRPGWGGGKLNATTIGLASLSDVQTSALIAATLDRTLLPADIQRALIERAAGNPLYAEQYAQLYRERPSADLPMPESLQGIIAARLDGLAAEDKALLQSASVLGKIFWAGTLDMNPDEALARLHGLERRGFVVRQRRSSVENDTEWSFAHVLLRDVAYGQIPRAERSALHRRAAEWIAGLGRPDDHAELIAHHWRSARDLAASAGLDTSAIDGPASVALRAAGDHASAIHAHAAAAGYYADALASWPSADPARASLQRAHAMALYLSGDPAAVEALESARDALLAIDDRDAAAEVEVLIGRFWWERGRSESTERHERRAEALVSDASSPSAAWVMASIARTRVIAGDVDGGRELAVRALALAEEYQLVELQSHALNTLGISKMHLADGSAETDLRRAIELGLAVKSPQAGTAAANLAVILNRRFELRRAIEAWDRAFEIAEHTGDVIGIRWLRGFVVHTRHLLGRWDEAVATADAFVAECETQSPHYLEAQVRTHRARMRIARGDRDGALEDHRRAILLARQSPDPQQLLPVISTAVLGFELAGVTDEARGLAEELVPLYREHPREAIVSLAEAFAISRLAMPYAEELKLMLKTDERPAGFHEVVLACLDREFVRAADLWMEAGSPSWAALLRMRAAEDLAAAGNFGEATAQAELALTFYRSVGATDFIDRLESLLPRRESA